nr:VOC family protein [Tissierella sp.]
MYNEFIIFLGTEDLQATDKFYSEVLGLKLYKDQKTCRIYRVNDSACLGFCDHIKPTPEKKSPIITLVTDDVDRVYKEIKAKGIDIEEGPKENKKFNIYHFFLKDNNGYTLEIQKFL